jgi:carboxymethylenebutenolidase
VAEGSAGSGYLVQPTSGPGPGILLLHSWWGLTPFFRELADQLADLGYTVLAPDLHRGETADRPDEAEQLLAEADVDVAAGLLISSTHTLRALARSADDPIGVIGFSMGASWAYWLSAKAPQAIGAVVAFYGTQAMALDDSRAAFLGHYAEHDEFVSEDEIVVLQADLRLLGRDVTFHRYPGTAHWFFESDRVPAYDESAARLAWERTLAFLREHLPPPQTDA